MSVATDEEQVVEGVVPDPIDVFYVTWGQETLRRVIPALNEVLRLMITLTTTLLGGSIFFLKVELLSPAFQALTIAAFLASLGFAFWGLLPYSGTVNVFCAADVRDFKERATEWKRRRLTWSALSLCVGFALAGLGLFLKATGLLA